ncbi:carbohydrate ABC transporter permease [Actinoplanes sp. GCM10030250]|uniref:carbohydrate ABC transporter permease n=1 Tax=Actinoplanes sp. GCM10030250 TaxID=3273376 RepID=UPI00361AB567
MSTAVLTEPKTEPAEATAAPPRRWTGSIGYHLGALAVLVVVLYPGVWTIASSFKDTSQIVGSANPFTASPNLDNFRTALSGIAGISFWRFFGNSLLLAVLSVATVVVSSALSAYALARIRFPGRDLWFALMIGTMLVPAHVMLIPQYIVFQKAQLVNTLVPLLIGKVLATDAFFVFLMVQFIRSMPRELDEAAQVDGAGHGRIFWSIILPLLRPAIVTSSIFAFIWSWNDFLGPLLYLKKPEMYTLPLALRLYIDQTTTSDYGAQIAMAVLALVPVMLMFFVFQRYLIEGVATQGLKG